MASLKVKHTDGTWKTVIDGKLKVKWGADWVSPSTVKIQWGGQWIDTGYRGFPSVPANVHVYSWDYNDVRIAWSAGAGGAPIADYHVVQTDSAGNWLRQYTVEGGLSPSIPVSVSTHYIFWVRSRTAANLYSDWGNTVKTLIGKPASTYYTTENATRGWSSGAVYVEGYRDHIVGAAVPSSVVCTSVAYNISSQGGFTSILSPYRYREIYAIRNSGQYERFSWGNPVNYTLNVTDFWGNGGISGFICRGEGWSSAQSGPYKANGYVTASGTEHYTYQQAHTIPAVANSYW